MGVLSVIKDYGTELLNSVRDNDLKTFKQICEKHLQNDSKIAELCVMDMKHRPTQKFACPLILAARLDDPAIIRYMLEIGVNPNFVHHSAYSTKRKELLTPLHVAVEVGLRKTVELLMRYNADPNVPDHNEDTPFILAVKKSDWVMMKMLLSSGANTMLPDRFGNAPIHIATLYGHLQMVKSLMKQGADLYQKGHHGAIPSHIAAKEGHVHLVQVFCSNDPALINAKIPCFEDKREKAPIHLACENGQAETVIALLDQFGAEMNLTESQGNTPLHCLVLHPYCHYKMRDKDYYYAIAKILIKYNAKINERNKQGNTPLHLAAMNNHPKIVELLLNIGANPMTENHDRMKPIDLVPDRDAVTKQLIKDHMLNPRPAMNISSLSLIPNSSFHIGATKYDPASRNNTLKSSPQMKRSYTDQSLRKIKPPSYSISSSSSSVFVKDPRKHSYFSPRMKNELMHPIFENNHIPHMGNIPSTMEHSSKSLKYYKNRKKYDYSTETSTATTSTFIKKKHKKHSYSSDDTSTTYRKDRRGSHRRHRSSDAKHRSRHGRRKYSHSYDSDSTIKKKHHSKRDQDFFSSDEGIKVTTYEGKPKTIEVEYEKGPITIEFENEDDVFEEKQKVKKHKKSHKRDKTDKVSKHKHSTSEDLKNEEIQLWYKKMKEKNKINKKEEKEEIESENSSLGEEFKKLENIKKPELTKKKKEKSNRQRQYDEQLEIERMPIEDPEPPIENFESRSEVDSESCESEDLESDIKNTQRILNESATKRISEVIKSSRARWSTDEYESDPKEVIAKKYNKPIVQDKKEENESESEHSDEENEKSFEEFLTSIVEVTPIETIKLETLIPNKINETLQKNDKTSNQKISVTKETTFDVERKGGLNLKVSGETPKAYNRAEKDAARNEFFSSQPVKIESSSEASDNESKSSLKRRKDWSKPSPPVFPGPPKINLSNKGETTFQVDKDYTHFLKPYKSIGKIEAETTLIDDAFYEETNTTTTTTKTITPSDSKNKIMPDDYKIKKTSETKERNKYTNNQIKNNLSNLNKSQESTEDSFETEDFTKIESNLAKKKSLNDLLENYDEEPTKGSVRSNRAPLVVDLKELQNKKETLKKNDAGSLNDDTISINSDIISNGNSKKKTDKESNSRQKKKSSNKKDRRNEKIDISSDDSFSNVEFSVNSKENKYNDSKNQNLPKTRRRINGDSNIKEKLPLNDKNTIESNNKVTDLDSLGLDTLIPSSNKDNDDVKAPYLKLDDRMYENLTGKKKDLKVNENNLKKDIKASKNLSVEDYKPPKPQLSPNSQRKSEKKIITASKVRQERLKTYDPDDLNYKEYHKKESTFLPKHPNRPYDVHKMSRSSDSESRVYRRTRKRQKAYSEAELSDFEPPDKSTSGLSYKQLALNALRYKTPRNQEKLDIPRSVSRTDRRRIMNINKPRRRRRHRGDYTLPSAGWYGHYELKRFTSLQSFSESEFDFDPNISFISDEEWSSEESFVSNLSLSKKYENPVYDSLMKFQKINDSRVEMRDKELDEIPLAPDPAILHKYDEIARLWMEQVDKETVQKFKTMYLSILPQGQSLPPSIYAPEVDEMNKLPQWVVAKGRVDMIKRTRRIPSESQDNLDAMLNESEEQSQILFFKVGHKWIELAWALFDRLQDDSSTVRMIKDIQLKSPDNLEEQVKDMMNRWWAMKGNKATIQELQRSLELAQMFYISENTPLDETESKFADINETYFEADDMLKAVDEKYDQTENGNLKGGQPLEEITDEKPLKKSQTSRKSSKALKKPRSQDRIKTPDETTFSASERDNLTPKKKNKNPIKQETNL